MNDTMLQAIVDIPGEDIRRGVSRVSPDHPLARSHPQAFVPSKAYPLPGVRTRDLREAGALLSRQMDEERARHERRVISARMREIERQDRERESREKYRRYESAEDRQRRVFWEETGRVLDSQREPEQRTPAVYEIGGVLAEEQRAELERIDQLWDGRAPWHKS